MFVCRGIQGVGISGVKRPDKLVKTSISCLKEMQEGGEEGELVVGGRGDIFIGGSRDVVGGSGNGVVDRVVESRLGTHLLPLGSTVRYKFTFARRGWDGDGMVSGFQTGQLGQLYSAYTLQKDLPCLQKPGRNHFLENSY